MRRCVSTCSCSTDETKTLLKGAPSTAELTPALPAREMARFRALPRFSLHLRSVSVIVIVSLPWMLASPSPLSEVGMVIGHSIMLLCAVRLTFKS